MSAIPDCPICGAQDWCRRVTRAGYEWYAMTPGDPNGDRLLNDNVETRDVDIACGKCGRIPGDDLAEQLAAIFPG